ncbi:MAG: ribonuclease E/G [Nanoarchaeota archaeon]|nr:ribonuclease E/G [Nanoarchaeota archaeon]
MRVKLRGIYSTALTKLLTEKGIEVVQPSKVINDRFNINDNEPATTIIYDKEDLNGITISGTNAEEITKIIFENLSDSALRKTEIGEIYCGRIKNIDNKLGNIIIDLGNEEGILPLQSYWGILKEGEKILVQVKGKFRGKKILSDKLRIFGENAVLIQDGFTKISKYIKSNEEKEKLQAISEELKKDGWGILWKAFADGKEEEILRNEIKELINQEKQIKEQFKQMNEPGLIKEGVKVFLIDFGAISKKELDDIRKKVITTIPGHHFLKSGGLSIVVDFAESLENIDYDIIAKKLNMALMKNGPNPGMFYEVIQKKIGKRDIVFKGIVESVNDEEIVIKRRLHAGGRYDGIGGQIKPGDYAITKFKPNGWIVEHTYFDKNGIQKGKYFNINTPVETYPNFARYIDLEVDVVEVGGKREIVDLEKLERVLKEGLIKKELADEAIKIANKIVEGEQK